MAVTQTKGDGLALYNGVKLPKLPEWDRKKYPYVCINESSSGRISVKCTTRSLLYTTFNGYTCPRMIVLPEEVHSICSFYLSDDRTAWDTDGTVATYDTTGTNDAKDLRFGTIYWTNTDIPNGTLATSGEFTPDGTIYLAATDPIPVSDHTIHPKSYMMGFLMGQKVRGVLRPRPAIAFAIYSADDNSLTFYRAAMENYSKIAVGGTYKGKTVTGLYTGIETDEYTAQTDLPWNEFAADIVSVSFEDVIRPCSTLRWFSACSALTYIENIGNLDTRNVTSMKAMFQGCSSLTSIDLSGFDTSNVTDMSYMFRECSALTSLDPSGFDTSKVTDMSVMFYQCSGLTKLDLSNFDTSNVTTMFYMFYNCTRLDFVDLRSFDTSKVANMSFMFGYAGVEVLDLTSFDTSNVTSMFNMFNGASNLGTIFVSDRWSTANVTTSTDMFSGCTDLVGENGTTYDSNNVTVTYAHIDTGGDPGYLSAQPALYLYNGVELPELPDYDSETYPYAKIYVMEDGVYRFIATDRATVFGEFELDGELTTKTHTVYSSDETVEWLLARGCYGAWERVSARTTENSATGSGKFLLWDNGEVFWTNHDIPNLDDGTIYLAATRPVLVT